MTTRDIRVHLREIYGVDVSADLISRVTDVVVEELLEWQGRPLAAVYPVIFIDAGSASREGAARSVRHSGGCRGVGPPARSSDMLLSARADLRMVPTRR